MLLFYYNSLTISTDQYSSRCQNVIKSCSGTFSTSMCSITTNSPTHTLHVAICSLHKKDYITVID